METKQHPHDQVQALPKGHLQMIFKDVNAIVEEAVKQKDAEIAFRYGAGLNATGQAVWVAMAHLIYEMDKRWGSEFPSDDSYIIAAASRWNKAPSTIRRYLDVWKWVMAEPEHSQKRLNALATKPFQGMWYIKAAAREGQLTEDDWREIEEAPDISTMHEISKRVRGEVGTAVKALKIMLDSDGTIRARRSGSYKVVGVLNVHDTDEVVQAAIERIQRESHMFWREVGE